ncbi:MAG: hypothetical protein ABR498_00915 [Candidatus Dormibacteria bacterium]
MIVGYLAALGVTLAVETPVHAAGLVALLRVRWPTAVRAGVAVNVTHPVAFLLVVPWIDRS